MNIKILSDKELMQGFNYCPKHGEESPTVIHHVATRQNLLTMRECAIWFLGLPKVPVMKSEGGKVWYEWRIDLTDEQYEELMSIIKSDIK